MHTQIDMLQWHKKRCERQMAWEERYGPPLLWSFYVTTFAGLLFMGTYGILW